MYSKTTQTKKTPKDKKECSKCKRTRLIKFFSTPKGRICSECKAKARMVKKQSSKGYLTKKLDDKWSREVKEKANFKCEICGKTETLNSHHVFSRSNRKVRHDLENGVCLCAKHHLFDISLSAHKAPIEFLEKMKEIRGEKWYERLRQKAKLC